MAGTVVKFILRAAAFVFLLITTGLIGNVIAANEYGASSATKAINFSIFVCAWSWLAVLLGGVGVFMASLAPSIIMIFLDGLTMLLTFIDAIVLSAKLRAIDCSDINAQYLPHSWIGFGTDHNEKRCREIQASTVFMWFLWAVFVPLLAFTIMDARGGSSGGGFGFGRRKAAAGPAMTQVSA